MKQLGAKGNSTPIEQKKTVLTTTTTTTTTTVTTTTTISTLSPLHASPISQPTPGMQVKRNPEESLPASSRHSVPFFEAEKNPKPEEAKKSSKSRALPKVIQEILAQKKPEKEEKGRRDKCLMM